MRKVLEIIAGDKIDIVSQGIDPDTYHIDAIWTVYDEAQVLSPIQFDTKTGEPLSEPVTPTFETAPLQHHHGVFLEDRIHDWNIRHDKTLSYYSRVIGRGEVVKILVEYHPK